MMSYIERVDIILRQKITEIQAFQNEMDVLNRARESKPQLAQPFWQDTAKPHLAEIRDRFMRFLVSLRRELAFLQAVPIELGAILKVLATIVREYQIDVHNLERAETIPIVALIAVYVIARLEQASVEQIATVLLPFLHDESQHVRLLGIFLIFSFEDSTFKSWISQIKGLWGKVSASPTYIADLIKLFDVKPKGVCFRITDALVQLRSMSLLYLEHELCNTHTLTGECFGYIILTLSLIGEDTRSMIQRLTTHVKSNVQMIGEILLDCLNETYQ